MREVKRLLKFTHLIVVVWHCLLLLHILEHSIFHNQRAEEVFEFSIAEGEDLKFPLNTCRKKGFSTPKIPLSSIPHTLTFSRRRRGEKLWKNKLSTENVIKVGMLRLIKLSTLQIMKRERNIKKIPKSSGCDLMSLELTDSSQFFHHFSSSWKVHQQRARSVLRWRSYQM